MQLKFLLSLFWLRILSQCHSTLKVFTVIVYSFCLLVLSSLADNYVGYSGSGYGWETYSGGGKRHDHSSGSGDDTYGWEEYSENTGGKNKHYQGDSDDEDIQ